MDTERVSEPGCEYCSGAPLSSTRDCCHDSISQCSEQWELLLASDDSDEGDGTYRFAMMEPISGAWSRIALLLGVVEGW